MFTRLKEKLTFYISTLVLLNASAFSGVLMSQAAIEEIVVTARVSLPVVQVQEQVLYILEVWRLQHQT